MTNGSIPEAKTIKVENIIIALNNMGSWCKTLAQALEPLDRDTTIEVPPELYEVLRGGPKQALGECLKQ